ncbi:TPA: hypothetical protein I7730_00260 [Vibrio vulnificus]|uniref:Uncharacterized protein n=1 Tax=Vibrio vulnificus TaxID=672 RepID=A0A8H9MY30_VIBVL|nr:hypothetical protein [Vibrio vulnificus]HAS8538231.1 hypothetical protein [Vibrio vulnificus]
MANKNAHIGSDLSLFRSIFQTPGYGDMQKVQDDYFGLLDLGDTNVTCIYLNCDDIHLNIGEYKKNSITEHHDEYVVINYKGRVQGYRGESIKEKHEDIAAWIIPQLHLLALATSKLIKLRDLSRS